MKRSFPDSTIFFGLYGKQATMVKKTRALLHGEITYSFAKDEEVNILHRLEYIEQQIKFFTTMYCKRDWMKAVVAHHLGLSPNPCSIQKFGANYIISKQFITLKCLPFWSRCLFKLRCLVLSWLGCPLPSCYLRHQPCMAESSDADTEYLLIEYIEGSRGRMLSETWSERRCDDKLRTNFLLCWWW